MPDMKDLPAFVRCSVILSTASVFAAVGGCSASDSSDSANAAVQKEEQPFATNYLTGIGSLDPSHTHADSWDVDLVNMNGNQYRVASAFTVDDSTGDRTLVFDIRWDPLRSTMQFRPPSPDASVPFTDDQIHAIGADLKYLATVLPTTDPSSGTPTGASLSSNLRLDNGGVWSQSGARCTDAEMEATLTSIGAISSGAAAVALCTVGEVLSWGADTWFCAGAAAATLAFGALAKNSVPVALHCLLDPCAEERGTFTTCGENLTDDNESRFRGMRITCKNGSTVTSVKCAKGCVLEAQGGRCY
jgi:hypothetical protein